MKVLGNMKVHDNKNFSFLAFIAFKYSRKVWSWPLCMYRTWS